MDSNDTEDASLETSWGFFFVKQRKVMKGNKEKVRE